MLHRRKLPDSRGAFADSTFLDPGLTFLLPQGVIIPEPMQKYMQGRKFLPYVRELPTTAAQKPAKQKH